MILLLFFCPWFFLCAHVFCSYEVPCMHTCLTISLCWVEKFPMDGVQNCDCRSTAYLVYRYICAMLYLIQSLLKLPVTHHWQHIGTLPSLKYWKALPGCTNFLQTISIWPPFISWCSTLFSNHFFLLKYCIYISKLILVWKLIFRVCHKIAKNGSVHSWFLLAN